MMLGFLGDVFYESCEVGDGLEEGQMQGDGGIDWERIRQKSLWL